MTAAEVREDLRRGAAAIEDATGGRPTWHRPPYGIYSRAGLAAAREAGLRPLLWSRWGKDWRKFTTPARIAARATRGLASGDVILLHDADFYSSKRSHERTVAALRDHHEPAESGANTLPSCPSETLVRVHDA